MHGRHNETQHLVWSCEPALTLLCWFVVLYCSDQFVVWSGGETTSTKDNDGREEPHCDRDSLLGDSNTDSEHSIANNSAGASLSDSSDSGAIIPLVQVAGTATRRAVEPTWLTASNPKVHVPAMPPSASKDSRPRAIRNMVPFSMQC